MPSLHMLGHMVAMAVIATLVKQIMELNSEVSKLKDQLEDIKETPGCCQEVSDSEKDEKEKNTKDIHDSENKDDDSDKTGNEKSDKTEDGNIDKTSDDKYDNTEDDNDDKAGKECVKNNYVERGSLTNTTASSSQTSEEFLSIYSSVWCHDGDNQMCQFENICYNSEAGEFVFFKHKSSTMENVKMIDGSITLGLSSFKRHNALETTVVSLPSEKFSRFQTSWTNRTTLVFKPFLMDNLMHVFHDDIIPLHHTLKLITMGDKFRNKDQPFDIQLYVFDDDTVIDDDMKKFYEVFSKFKIKSKEDFQTEGKLVCFKSVFIGLSKTTTWYDYGFTKPQGPLLNYKADSTHVRSTTEFIRQQLPLTYEPLSAQDYLVLFTRKENRKIINEYELILQIMKSVGVKIVNLNYESYTLLELIMYVSNAKGIIAMHGSLLILSMFLKPGSVVIELYPYAVNPSNYTPYKTLSGLKGMGLIYKAWINQIKENSIGHPNWPPDSGGLNHLEHDKREIILQQTDVPMHTCCTDPSWLYHIYQDTIVNTREVSALAKEALSESQTILKEENNSGSLFYPSKVQNVSCIIFNNSGKQHEAESENMFLKLQWGIPWTMSYMEFESLHYEVLVQHLDADSVESFQTPESELVVEVNFEGEYNVWVRSVIDNAMTGPYSRASLCKTDLI